MKKIAFIFGTRPEAIKMAPLIKAFERSGRYECMVCLTGQHREMLMQVVDFFEIPVKYNLDLMTPDQTLSSLTSKIIAKLDEIIGLEKPDLVFVQGDTTTVLAASIVSFYHKIKIAHIEAGLRSHDLYSPFPEEANRILTSNLVHFHFAPTPLAAKHLAQENITKNVFVTGNTVIDALYLCLNIIKEKGEQTYFDYFKDFDLTKKIVLVTCHRRENFGEPLQRIFGTLLKFAQKYPDTSIIYPVHLNPNVKQVAEALLKDQPNITLIPPLDYPKLVWLMNKSYFVLTDSGGIQEEAPSLGKPVLVLREVTERTEAVEAGTAKLVGTDANLIFAEMEKLMTDETYYKSFSEVHNPYGDGTASKQILDIIDKTYT